MSVDLNTLSDRSYAEDFAEFIKESPSSYHASDTMARRLSEAGFSQQEETAAWQGHQRGFVRRDGAIIAWSIPHEVGDDTGFRIVGSHTDSPTFKLKPNPESFVEGFSQVNVEVYGGPLLNSWLNRDLGIAGRVTTLDGETHLVHTPAVMTIPQLAPHLDRSQNDKLEMSRQRDYHPIWAIGDESVLEYVCAENGVDPERIAATDLYAYDVSEPALYGGADGEDFFVAGRQDNLSSAHASLMALISTDIADDGDIRILVSFDHEEVGSATYTGAGGPLLEAILRRIAESVKSPGEETFLRMLANSSCISADAGHSVNPNKAARHDPDHHPVLGHGPLLKVNANQRYATESTGSALWLRACAEAGVSMQEFVSNNDVPCGSTIGPFTATRLGIVTVDVGVPLLSMHSVREISSPRDLVDLAKVLRGYWAGV